MFKALLAGALASLAAWGALATEIVDATGVKVSLAGEPKRIVALAPSLGELAADVLGADLSRIVGVSEFTDYPPALKKTASVGPYFRFNVEAVAALKPDLVLATRDGNPKDQVNHLRELGLPVLVVPAGDFSAVEASINMVSEALGRASTGADLAMRFREGLARIRARAEVRGREGPAPRVFLEVGSDPLVTAGKGTFLNDALGAIGAENVFGDLSGHYPRPSMEAVVSRDPDLILILALGPESPKQLAKKAADWRRFKTLKAVAGGRVQVLKADALLRPSMRLLEGLALLERVVFPAAAAETKQ